MIAWWPWVAAALLAILGGLATLCGAPTIRAGLRRTGLWVVAVAAASFLASGGLPRDPAGRGLLLLTPGTTAAGARAFAGTGADAWHVVSLDGGDWSGTFPDAERAPSLRAAAIQRTPAAGGPIAVLGWGLRTWEWESAGIRPTRFEAPGEPSGLLDLSWTRDLTLGEPLEARVRLSVEGPVTVSLSGPGGDEARAELDAEEGPRTVALTARPRLAGRHVYTLAVEPASGGGPIRELPVDVAVREPPLPAVLWLEGAPSFESREVKAWLAGLGAAVAVRSRISRGRDRREILGFQDPPSLDRLDGGILGRFDLLIVDHPAWRRLSGTEQEAVSREVEEGGMGLLLWLGDGKAGDLELPRGIRWQLEGVATAEMVRPGWVGGPPDPTPLEDAGIRLAGEEVRSLVRDRTGKTLAGWRPMGRGRIGVSALAVTFPWRLEGREDLHRSYWSALLSTLARPAASDRWILPPGPVLVHDPLRATLVTAASSPEPRVQEPDGTISALAPRQDPWFPTRWEVTFHPRTAGWHRLASVAGAAWFRADDAAPWGDRERALRVDETRAALGSEEGGGVAPPVLPSRLLLWVLAVGALAALWADERFAAVERRVG